MSQNRQKKLLAQQTYVLSSHLVQLDLFLGVGVFCGSMVCECVYLKAAVRGQRQRQTPPPAGCQRLATNDAAALSSAN